MKQKQIGFFYDGTAYGGVEIHLKQLLQHIDRARYNPVVIISSHNYQDAPERIISEIEEMGIPLLTPPKSSSFNLFHDIIGLGNIYRQTNLDIIHIHTSRLNGARRAILAARQSKVKGIIRSEHVPPSLNLKSHHSYFVKPFDMLTDYIVVGSKTCFDEQVELVKRNRNKLYLSYYGIEVERYNHVHNVMQAKSRLGFDPSIPTVGVVARLAIEKGLKYLIGALAQVIKQVGPVNFLLVGNGPLEAELKQQVADLDLVKYVHFFGFQSETRPFIEAMDITAMSSINEGISLAMLENMAMGKPVVATDEPSFVETVVDGVNGLIVPRGNSNLMAEAIIKLIQNPLLAKQMGRAGRERVFTYFNLKRQIEDLMLLYDKVLDINTANLKETVCS